MTRQKIKAFAAQPSCDTQNPRKRAGMGWSLCTIPALLQWDQKQRRESEPAFQIFSSSLHVSTCTPSGFRRETWKIFLKVNYSFPHGWTSLNNLHKKNDTMHPLKIQRYMFVVLSKTWYHSVVHQLKDGKELRCNEGYTATKKERIPKRDTRSWVSNAICWEKRSHSQITRYLFDVPKRWDCAHRGARALGGGMKFWEIHVCL